MTKYRLVNDGEEILPDDEFYQAFTDEWKVSSAVKSGCVKRSFHLPCRRKVPECNPPEELWVNWYENSSGGCFGGAFKSYENASEVGESSGKLLRYKLAD